MQLDPLHVKVNVQTHTPHWRPREYVVTVTHTPTGLEASSIGNHAHRAKDDAWRYLASLVADHYQKLFKETNHSCTPPQRSTNRDQTVAVDHHYHWQPITDQTPRGKKLQLVNREAGVAVYGQLGTAEAFFTHWAPLPTFKD